MRRAVLPRRKKTFMRAICGFFCLEQFPGLLLGTFVLKLLGNQGGNPVVVILLGTPARSIFKRDVRSARAESGFRSEEFPLVALARPPHRRRIRILFRRCWRARSVHALN